MRSSAISTFLKAFALCCRIHESCGRADTSGRLGRGRACRGSRRRPGHRLGRWYSGSSEVTILIHHQYAIIAAASPCQVDHCTRVRDDGLGARAIIMPGWAVFLVSGAGGHDRRPSPRSRLARSHGPGTLNRTKVAATWRNRRALVLADSHAPVRVSYFARGRIRSRRKRRDFY
jgi:hypothetical protein